MKGPRHRDPPRRQREVSSPRRGTLRRRGSAPQRPPSLQRRNFPSLDGAGVSPPSSPRPRAPPPHTALPARPNTALRKGPDADGTPRRGPAAGGGGGGGGEGGGVTARRCRPRRAAPPHPPPPPPAPHRPPAARRGPGPRLLRRRLPPPPPCWQVPGARASLPAGGARR